jgi:hypothetical protein
MEEVARRKKMRFSGEKGGTFSFSFDSIHSALERQEGRTRRTE